MEMSSEFQNSDIPGKTRYMYSADPAGVSTLPEKTGIQCLKANNMRRCHEVNLIFLLTGEYMISGDEKNNVMGGVFCS